MRIYMQCLKKGYEYIEFINNRLFSDFLERDRDVKW